MRPGLLPLILSLAAAPAGAQPDAQRLQALYSRLCNGAAPASEATCAALGRDLERAGAPVAPGWAGLGVGASDDGAPTAFIFSVWPDGPAALAGLRGGDRIISVDGQAVSDGATFVSALSGKGIGRRVLVETLRDGVRRKASVTLTAPPVLEPKLNASRPEKRSYSIWNGRPETVDPIRLGETLQGMLERDDAESVNGWSWKADCIEVLVGDARNLRAQVTANRKNLQVDVQYDRCGYGLPWSIGGYGFGDQTIDVDFRTIAGRKTFLHVMGPPSSKPYEIKLREQTLRETARWVEVTKQVAIAEQERKAAEARAAQDRSAMWGAALQGAIIGASGGQMPAMREDGSTPNLLETLNGVNAQLQQQNAQGKARLDATIAQAQAQAQGAQPRQSLAAVNAPSSPGRGAAPANSTLSAGAGTRTVRMVLWAGMVPTEADTNPKTGWGRNPLCQSNIITATIRRDDRSALPEQELFERHRANFVAKCERLGTLTGPPTYIVETPNSSRFGEFGWNDRRVTLP